jgi:hypothetical protein
MRAMRVSTRLLLGRRVWTLETAGWRFSIRMLSWRWGRAGIVRDTPPGAPFAGRVELPFACMTAFQNRGHR